uniref:AlNc14C55G4197 protein n=1 Tax=Albugo laibachii Nc14 TaxID=890382 RepID=F0WC10_9STRA|nr:AlNc14C55G4197 [Albugo laibachii Nc14]|eukprot:CCA18691.1 AlNc14C55G4197 [Albugo laibachii Nc14]
MSPAPPLVPYQPRTVIQGGYDWYVPRSLILTPSVPIRRRDNRATRGYLELQRSRFASLTALLYPSLSQMAHHAVYIPTSHVSLPLKRFSYKPFCINRIRSTPDT